MKRKLLKLLCGLLVLALIVAGFLFYAIYLSPEKVTLKYESISSTKIPDSLDNVTIGYFSDIYYLEFMDQERLQKMMDDIKEANVDVLLFGGDLIYQPDQQSIDADMINLLTSTLSQLEAPLGKFYVLGEHDNVNSDTRALVSTILYNAGFEEMSNRNTKLHNGNQESITLIGLENEINGSVDIQSAFTNVSNETFNLFFVHTPDSFALVPENSVDLGVAGHSLGGQIHIPILGSLGASPGAQKYNNGNYTVGSATYVVSNGLGTHKSDMRLFCPPQFNIFVLQKK